MDLNEWQQSCICVCIGKSIEFDAFSYPVFFGNVYQYYLVLVTLYS